MNKHINSIGIITLSALLVLSCKQPTPPKDDTKTKTEKPEYFLLRPELEKMYGYTQAVRVGNLVKIGGVISIDDQGKPIDKDDYLQQMKNCYVSIEKVLKHYGCIFDDV